MRTNCPNCGAVITSDKCEYCGTLFRHTETETVTLYADDKAIAVFTAGEPAQFGISTAEAAEAFNRLGKEVREVMNNV